MRELPADMKSPDYGHPHDPAWLASKISKTKSAISGSINLACLAWNDGGALMKLVFFPISVSITQKTAPNVKAAAISNATFVMAAT
ncbi:hypothetical protein CWR43_14290 [Rhizobium sullae]|uniref:Uncharacterized protein n=2 Tax=Rhizobium sullae TaxID=50338 RepID=A0A2N0DAU9_RHISU|nr:hypothetical protein CWR43_14290 [Rhizobium sullae]